jgi:hypothetical protein
MADMKTEVMVLEEIAERTILDGVVEQTTNTKREVVEVYCAYCGACPPKSTCYNDRWIMQRKVTV